MSSLALGFSVSTGRAGLLTSFPGAGVVEPYVPAGPGVTYASGSFNATTISADLPVYTSTSLHLSANRLNGFSDTFYDFTFTTGGTINFTWSINNGESSGSVFGSYYTTTDSGTGTPGDLGTIASSVAQKTTLSGSAPVSVTLNNNDLLVFEISATQKAGGKLPAYLDVTVVPEFSTWLSGLLLVGMVTVTVIRQKNVETLPN